MGKEPPRVRFEKRRYAAGRRKLGHVPGHGHDKRQRQLLRLDVAHVDDPHHLRAAVVGGTKLAVQLALTLLEGAENKRKERSMTTYTRRRVQPLAAPRMADILHVVIDLECQSSVMNIELNMAHPSATYSCASTALSLFLRGKPPDGPEVVVGKQQRHVVGHLQPVLVVLLHFLVQRNEFCERKGEVRR